MTEATKGVAIGPGKGRCTIDVQTFGVGMYRVTVFDGVQNHDVFLTTSQLTSFRGNCDRALGEGRKLRRKERR